MNAIILINPKFPHNVGGALRAAACYGIEQVLFTGDRVSLEASRGYRLPREERMRGFRDVELRQTDRPFDLLDADAVPVAVEVRDQSESLVHFDHPKNAVYVFGPEDGSLTRGTLGLCHRFIAIPTLHCTNLAAAVYTVLYDRYAKEERDLLARACKAANETRPEDYIVYDQAALAELRRE